MNIRTIVLVGLSFLLSNVVPAQSVLEEVTVTARKRVESLQETPLSVVAFGPEALEAQNVADLEQLSIKLPNVHIGAGGGLGANNGNIIIRGLGADRNAVNQEQAVALYIDDAYYGRSDGSLLHLLDVERIEVLRGPQGTLFGRNATAGAVRYITQKPDDEFAGKVQATIGSDERIDVKGSVNLPISDTAAVRLSAATLNQDGYQKNALGQDLGDRGTDMVRAYLRWDASDQLEVLVSLDYSDTDTNGSPNSLLGINPNSPGIRQAIAAGTDPTDDPLYDTKKSGSTLEAYNDTQSFGAAITLNWDVTDNLSVKSASTYRELDVESQYDFDATEATLFENHEVVRDIEIWSQELQLNGVSFNSRLNWVAGFFYYHEESYDSRFQGAVFNPGIPVPGASISSGRYTLPHELESYAAYGQGTFDLTDRLSFTGGIRWTRDEKDITITETNFLGRSVQYRGDDPNGNSGDLVESNSHSWSAISGRASLELQVTDDIFLYAAYARGFRSGGINDRVRNNLPLNDYGLTPFDEETIDLYELGFRGDLMDQRMRLNMTVFYQDFKDLQFARSIQGTNRTVVQSAAGAEAYGLESEIIWAIADNFQLDGSLGLMHTEITDVEEGVTLTKGDKLGTAPNFKYNIGAEYSQDLGNGMVDTRLDYGWTGGFIGNPSTLNRINVESYGLLSATVKYTTASERWSIAAYGSNLTDKDYFNQALNFQAVAPFGYAQGTPGRGREGGVKLELSF